MIKLSDNQQAIVNAIKNGHVAVVHIAEVTGLTKGAVSANIKPLRDKGVIETYEVDGVTLLRLTTQQEAPTATTAPIATNSDDTIISIDPSLRPREIVQALIKAGTPKKVAKHMIYNTGFGRNGWKMGLDSIRIAH